MKLRLRSVETKETFKLDVPTPLSLDLLASLVAERISSPPSSLRFSLNRRDPLSSPLPLASGDLLFFTTDPLGFSSSLPAPPTENAIPPPEMEVSSSSIPGFLRPAIQPAPGGDLGLFAASVHTVLLESGFVVSDEGFISSPPSAVVSISYTVLAVPQPVNVKVSLVGKFASIYGSTGGGADVYRVCLDAGRFLPAIEARRGDEKEIFFEMWKSVKDGIALPLLIDVCERNGLPPPPCFARLPTELKTRVLELVPGADLARIACVSSELRHLASNDDLWARKIVEEFGCKDVKGLFGEKWKDQFVACWRKRKRQMGDAACRVRYRPPRMPPFWDRRVPFPSPRFNVIGGDYDRFPSIGYLGSSSANQGFRRSSTGQSFSPHCIFGSFGR